MNVTYFCGCTASAGCPDYCPEHDGEMTKERAATMTDKQIAEWQERHCGSTHMGDPVIPAAQQATQAAGEPDKIRTLIREHYEREGDETGINFSLHLPLPELVAHVLHNLMSADRLAESAGEDAERAIQRAVKAEGDLESARSPNEEQMARLNETVTRLNAENAALRRLSAAQPPEQGLYARECALYGCRLLAGKNK